MEFRTAVPKDLPAIVRLLADDELGAARERNENPLPQEYRDAFAAMERQGGNIVMLVVDDGGVIGCLQLTYIAGLGRLGMTRAQIEGVRIDRRYRGRGVGEALVHHAIERAPQHGCGLIQLTTDRSRGDAHRFYERLGFEFSHLGMKLDLRKGAKKKKT